MVMALTYKNKENMPVYPGTEPLKLKTVTARKSEQSPGLSKNNFKAEIFPLIHKEWMNIF